MTLKTMLAAAAVTIGMLAHGEVTLPNGTSFESMTARTVGKTELDAQETAGAAWTVPTNQTVTAYVQGDKQAETRPKQFSTSSQDKYLAVKTALGTEFLKRTLPETVNVTDGFYVDTLVKFTASDNEDIEVPSDAKIGVWVKANEDETKNYLMVSAGPVVDEKATIYNCGDISDVDAWKRLTIKALYNTTNDKLAFVVYVDGAAIGCDDAKGAFEGQTLTPNAQKFATNGNLFPSIVDSNKLSELAISGQGGIDDISFTAEAPDFAKDYEFINLTFDTKKIAKLYVTDGEGHLQEFTASPANYEIVGATDKSYYYDAQPGYISVGSDAAIAIDGTEVDITDVKVAAFTVGETDYATWAEAVAEAITADASIVLNADYEMDATDLAASINNVNGVTTIDLNGKTLTGCVYATTDVKFVGEGNIDGLAVYDSEESPDSTLYAVMGDAKVFVEGGTFKGFVVLTQAGETPDKTISGGLFYEQFGSQDFYLAGNLVDSYEAVPSNDWWIVQEVKVQTAEVTIDAGTGVKVTVVDGDGNPITTGTKVAVDTELTITAAADTDYELKTLTVNGADFTSGEKYTVESADAITIAATAEAIPYVAQVGDKKFLTFEDAFTNAVDGATIKFLSNFTGPFKTGVYGTSTNFVNGLTIDLNGKTWQMTGDGEKNERLWEDRCGNSFLIKNGSLKAVPAAEGKNAPQSIAFYTYAETLEFNNVALDFSALKVEASADPVDPRKSVPIVSQNGNVKFTGTTTVKLATNQRLVTMLDRANPLYVPGTLTLDVNGELAGDILLYSEAKIAVGANTKLTGKVFTGAAAESGFTPASAAGSPFVAMVGAILPKTGSTSTDTRGGQLYTSIEDAQAVIATTTFAKNVIVLQDATKDSFEVVSGVVNFEIPADVTFEAKTLFTLNGAKVALAGSGKITVPAALDIAKDFATAPTGMKVELVKDSTYTYQLVKAAEPVDPEQPKTYDTPEAAADAAKAINDNPEAYIKSPKDATEGFNKADYVKNFEAVAVGNSVVVQLTETAQAELQEQVNSDVVTKIKPAELAAAAGKAALTTTPGFYYTVVAGNGIGTMAPKSCTFAAGTETEVNLPSFSGAGFYSIKVTVKPVEIK